MEFEVRRCHFELYLAARPHLVDISNSKLAGSRKGQNGAWLLSTVQNGGNDVEFWAPLETNFIRKTSTSEAKTSVSS